MSYKLEEYLDLAEKILKLDGANKGEDNAYLRCSLSRAYYSVFCIARNHKNMKYEQAPYFHEAVLEKYRNSHTFTKKDDKQIYVFLNDLRRLRVKADYHEEQDLKMKDAETGIEKAKECLKIIRQAYGDNYNYSF